jgi:acyl-CoA reductase-like NAD-dependent aldehyde dehydrogenase
MTVIDERVSSATRTAIERELFGHVIDGERIAASSGATLDVVDPSTGDFIAKAAAGNAHDVDRAARSARAAFEDGR